MFRPIFDGGFDTVPGLLGVIGKFARGIGTDHAQVYCIAEVSELKGRGILNKKGSISSITAVDMGEMGEMEERGSSGGKLLTGEISSPIPEVTDLIGVG